MSGPFNAQINYCKDTKMWEYKKSLDDTRLYSLKWVAVNDAKNHLQNNVIDILTVYTKNNNVELCQHSKNYKKILARRAAFDRATRPQQEVYWKNQCKELRGMLNDSHVINRDLIDQNKKLLKALAILTGREDEINGKLD